MVADWLNPELTTLAFCWRLMRRDGVTLGLTSHDADLDVGGLCYRSTPGLVPSSIELTSSFDRDTVSLTGALTSDAFRDEDLAAGRWDGAALWLFLVDWTAPVMRQLHLVRGSLGDVSVADGRFTVDLLGQTHAFDAPVVEETAPDCRAFLGDKRCRVDMAGRTQMVSVQAAVDNVITLAENMAAGLYNAGRLRWLDGPNAGLSLPVAGQLGQNIYLAKRPHFTVMAGTRALLTEGCDGRFATCTDRFSNAANFRGEPHLPGNDLLTRYAL